MNRYKRKDYFSRKAEEEGYVARSALKLQELDLRFHLFSMKYRVLDLGASPGSWTQYALSRIGPKGHIVAVDIQALKIAASDQVTFVQGTVGSANTSQALSAQGPYHVVISDLAPRTTGNRIVDTTRSEHLFSLSLQIAHEQLRQKGKFVAKIFQGHPQRTLLEKLRQVFRKTYTVKPAASRSQSFEAYFVGIDPYE